MIMIFSLSQMFSVSQIRLTEDLISAEYKSVDRWVGGRRGLLLSKFEGKAKARTLLQLPFCLHI